MWLVLILGRSAEVLREGSTDSARNRDTRSSKPGLISDVLLLSCSRCARIVRMQTRTHALLTVLALSQMEYVDYTVERPLCDVLITRHGMWFDVKNADGAVNEHDIQLFLTEFAEVHFMAAAAAAAAGRAESLMNNGFTSKHALASLTAVQLEKFGVLVGHPQVLASYLGGQQHRMPLMNSPPSTGVTDTGHISPPPLKAPIQTGLAKKRPAAQAFPPALQAGRDAQAFQPAFQATPASQPAPSQPKKIMSNLFYLVKQLGYLNYYLDEHVV